MELIRRRASARAGLIGNPSDGYGGKTLSISVRNFWADVVLYEWDQVELVLSQEDRSRFRNIQELARDVQLHGYYGGVRLVKSTIKKFVDYCNRHGLTLHDRNFSIRYESNIPRQVGLAGSSAIIVATLRCLCSFYEIDIPQRVQPSLALSVETEELGIGAGLQDRVVQVYEGLVAMDFSPAASETIDGYICGQYQPMPADLLPPLYVAYRADHSGPTEIIHNDLRARYNRGDKDVLAAIERWAAIADEAKAALLGGDFGRFGELVDENFDLRRRICQLPAGQAEMVDIARSVGATAKFSGSGGAIIGTYRDAGMLGELREQFGRIGCPVILPLVAAN